MLGTIQHILNASDILKLVISLSVLLYLIALIVIHGKMKQNEKSEKIWNLLCFVPLLLSVIHCIFFASGDVFSMVIQAYQSIYIPSVLIAFLPLLAKKKPLKIICNVFCVAISLIILVLSLGSGKVANYTRKSMKDAYLSACDYIEENYVLADWKKVDFEKLKADGLVLVDEAEKTGNTAKYYDALYMLINSLHDAHAGVSIYDNESSYIMDKIKVFGDYGLSLITLDNGDTIAVNVEEGLEIKNGDIITKWDGIPVDEAIDQVVLPTLMGTTTVEHEKMDKTFFLAGVGEDTVNVTYINSAGKEIVATLSRIEGNQPRAYKSIELFTRLKLEEELNDYRMLDDNIGYLRVTDEKIDEISDRIGYVTGNHTTAREMFRNDLRELKAQGMTKLVIDIRYNAGGSNDVATALTSLFTKEKMFAYSLGVKNGEEIKGVSDRYVMADGEFSDLEVVVLTSMRCGSAGDGLSLYLSRLPNVTVAGLTNPIGINQETGGLIFMPESVIIYFPTGLVLDENGNPNIDIDDTRQSRNPVDIKIPLDKDAALKIFSGEEYELEWAVDYLNGDVS
ncbi:MAG: S41 family peptidase [Ruminococcus sp.]|nr:S41 family peptidase [Ruminococcus sp.]